MRTVRPTPRRNTVTILAFDGSMEMSVVMTRDMFHAGAVAQQHAEPSAVVSPGKQVVVASQDGDPVRTFSGSMYQPDCSMTDIDSTELVVVSGIWCEIEQLIIRHRTTVEWILKQHQQGARIACLHTGAFLLAETGLLDNKVATVYWRMIEEFKSRYPKVILQPEKNITSSGNLFCSAGVSSGIEMGIYLLEKLWGVSVAAKVSRHFLMDIPRAPVEFQLALDQQKQHKDSRIQTAQQWLESNFSSDFLLEEVAEKVCLSLRSFRRRFKDATGETPMQYLQRIRLETAKQLLATSTLGVDQVSYRVGYEDASYFCRIFKQKLKVTPGEYRANMTK
ncbi:transcriptional regulator, AraC family with amidase-like domain [Pseudomonas pohangensis]|uniref:Transcriptional regulator, AraC family with amidase-like domain n=2 Tax=Pseudomonas pohangensis TaxID=364197 RepID=A0A1H2GKY4_9PSED|nr:transcriptional regulator, AraC family with amidase-like domain [Pseudomonas pohangensis]